jgi:hypothetical protein
MVEIWLFHPKKFLNFYTFCSKEIFLVLSGYMQPKKRTLMPIETLSLTALYGYHGWMVIDIPLDEG